MKLAGDLRSDNARGNAERAEGLLCLLWPTSRDALEAALEDCDRQARMIAAAVLRKKCGRDASDQLLRACIEDLRDDGDAVPWWTSWNARTASEYLVQLPDRIEPLLSVAMRSGDWQQRFLAAAIAGHCGHTSLLPQAAPILIPQLRDNRISGDAKIAAPALFRFGPEVIPFLAPFFEDEDRQLRGSVRAIAAQLLSPDGAPRNDTDAMPRISQLTNDPLREIPIGEGIFDLGYPPAGDEQPAVLTHRE
jgi:hypothetical protein